MARNRAWALSLGLLTAAAVASLPAGDAEAEVVPLAGTTFTKKKPAQGDVRLEQTRTDLKLTITVGGKSIVTANQGDDKKRETVLGADGQGVVNHLKVQYLKARKETTNNGQRKQETDPVEGKTYVLKKKGAETVVTYPQGGAPPVEEVEAVRDDYKRFGKPDRMFEAMPTTPLKPGDRVPGLERAMADSFTESGQAPLKVKRVEVTFRGRKGPLGLFDVDLELGMEQAPLQMRFPLKGVLQVRVADSWPVKMEVAGPVEVKSTGSGGPPISGGGRMKVVSTSTYPR